jgi:acyl-CoA oxidase
MSETTLPGNTPALAEKLQTVLDGDYADIRNKARAFESRPDLLPPEQGISKEAYRDLTMKWTLELAKEGFSKIPFDKKYGGEGDPRKSVNFLEVLAHQDLSFVIKQGVNYGLFGLSVQSLGTEKQHKKYLNDIMNGKLTGGFAMTEVGGGSDVQSVKTEAIYDKATHSFTINTPTADAKKAFIGNAATHGEMMVVFAQLKMDKDAESQGVHAFIVPVRASMGGKVLPGVTIEDCGEKVGLNGVDNGYIIFDNVKIPQDAMLDRFATIDNDGNYHSDIPKKTARFFKMIGTLVTGRVALSMGALSAAKNALAESITYADTRNVFGTPLLDKQSAQSRIFPKLASAYAMHFATRELVDQYAAAQVAPSGGTALETLAAALKSKSTDDAIDTIDEGRRMAGGSGYMAEKNFGRWRNDIDVFRTFEGDNTVLRLLVAKNKLNELRKAFANAAVPPAPVAVVSTDPLDPAFQTSLFARRENALLFGIAGKVMAAGTDAVAANAIIEKSQNDMLAYSDAYAEKTMIEQFVKNVAKQNDPETKAALKQLCDIFAVNTLLKHATWYLENGLLKPEQTKALTALADTLNEQLRPQAVALVKAFAIPQQLLEAPKLAPASNVLPFKKAANGPKQ